MSKSGLGKGLGDLMNGDQVAGKARVVSGSASTATTTTTTAGDVTLGRGLTTLVSAHQGDAEPGVAQKKKRTLLPAWFFFAADLLLLGYALAISFDAPRPFDAGTVLFCGVSIGLGCVLALVGLARAVNERA